MRRVASIILFVLGGWFLSSEVMMAWIDFTEGAGGGLVQLLPLAVIVAFALPFLLLGAWASPGNRWAELGLTLMIIAAIGAFMAVSIYAVLADPGMKEFMPPGQPMPDFHFAPVAGALNLLLLAGGGYALRRWARGRPARPDLEQVFGDD